MSDRLSRQRPSRRQWLRGLAAGGMAALALAGRKARAFLQLHPDLNVRQQEPLNAETPTSAFADFITPNELFFIRGHNRIPASGGPDRIEIAGLVDQELSITLEELEAMDPVTVTAVLQCSGNGRANYEPQVGGVLWDRGAVGNAEWTGVRLRDLLHRAGIGEGARHVRTAGVDEPIGPDGFPFLRSLPMARALHPSTLVAYRMNGEPLPREHGGPLRLVVPNWFGNHWTKWLGRIEVSRDEADGHYQKEAYRIPEYAIAPGTAPDPSAMETVTVMPVKSLFARPMNGSTVAPGRVEVVGVAWSGMGPIDRVEVAVGPEGNYRPATLVGPKRPFAWRHWRFDWQAEPGTYELRVRATDAKGLTQPDAVPWNPKGYIWNGVDRIEVRVANA